MRYEKCVHYEACKDIFSPDYLSDTFEDAINCEACNLFKNKADFAEMKHGRWVEVAENSTGKIIACTNCKKHINPNKKDVAMNRASERPGYCPNCGAKMDLEEGESDG